MLERGRHSDVIDPEETAPGKAHLQIGHVVDGFAASTQQHWLRMLVMGVNCTRRSPAQIWSTTSTTAVSARSSDRGR